LPKNTFDNSPNTRWSNPGVGSWIDYDLGQKKAICQLDIDWYRGQFRANSFTISVSLDGISYSNAFSGKSDGKTIEWERYDFTDVEARHVKITVNGNTENKWASISEVRIFGYPASTQTPLPTPPPPPPTPSARTTELDIATTYPKAGSTIKGTITAVATVSGNVNVKKIDGFLDSTLIRTELYKPYEFKFDTTKFVDGPHKFRAIATGSSGLTATVEIRITIQNQISPPQQQSPSTPPPLAPAPGSTLIHSLTSTETRTIIPVQMLLPNGQWSKAIKFNFDNGASWPTDVPPELLQSFGSGPDGVPSSERKEQPTKIRIVGLAGEYSIPVMIQDKAHYDLFRDQPPPERYPALRMRDLLSSMSFVYGNETTIIRTNNLGAPPELDNPQRITLPDMVRRDGTPTSGWQWMRVRFEDPSDSSKSVEDWFGLNTGDKRMIIKKSLADSIGLALSPGRNSENFDTVANFVFIEADPILELQNVKTEAREDSARFARGGEPRNFGGGHEVLDHYSVIFWDAEMHRALVPAKASVT